MKRFLLSFCLTAAAVPAFAAAPPAVIKCYSPQDYRAEQAIRYHSQLMVAGMLCQKILGQQSYSQYQGFTLRNQGVITKAENRLITYFKDHKEPAPEKALHTLRTNLANDLSVRAMQQALPTFCAAAGPRLRLASTMQPRQFENYLMRLDLRQGSTTPLCVQNAVVQPVSAQVKPPAAKPAVKAVAAVKPGAGKAVSKPTVKTDTKPAIKLPVKTTVTPVSPVKSTVSDETAKTPSQPQKQ